MFCECGRISHCFALSCEKFRAQTRTCNSQLRPANSPLKLAVVSTHTSPPHTHTSVHFIHKKAGRPTLDASRLAPLCHPRIPVPKVAMQRRKTHPSHCVSGRPGSRPKTQLNQCPAPTMKPRSEQALRDDVWKSAAIGVTQDPAVNQHASSRQSPLSASVGVSRCPCVSHMEGST